MDSNDLLLKEQQLLNEYSEFASISTSKIASLAQTKQATIDEMSQLAYDTVDTLESLLKSIRQYSAATQSATDFHSFREVMVNIVKERQKSRDQAMDLKQEKKAAKTVANEKLEQLKADIERLNNENNKITEQLKPDVSENFQLPLVCRLMRHTE